MEAYFKKYLKLDLTISLSVWAFIYLFKTFCIWKFTNPFQWLIDMPTYGIWDRAMILLFYLAYKGILVMIVTDKTNKII